MLLAYHPKLTNLRRSCLLAASSASPALGPCERQARPARCSTADEGAPGACPGPARPHGTSSDALACCFQADDEEEALEVLPREGHASPREEHATCRELRSGSSSEPELSSSAFRCTWPCLSVTRMGSSCCGGLALPVVIVARSLPEVADDASASAPPPPPEDSAHCESWLLGLAPSLASEFMRFCSPGSATSPESELSWSPTSGSANHCGKDVMAAHLAMQAVLILSPPHVDKVLQKISSSVSAAASSRYPQKGTRTPRRWGGGCP
mmetsp:Transcript_132018/g.368052  ORF Transcript_132018/g.368052 Transcript_132018/m.368052 type:complete len:267 (+) Transcript_132018:354-1154(+)